MSRRAATSRTRLVHRHRELVLGGEAHRRVELLGVAQVRQLHGSDDDLLVGDADADALAEALVLAEQRAQGLGQRLRVGHLAVPDDARLERREGGLLDLHAAVDRHRGGGDAARVDVDAHQVLDSL
jgi:hypothetical protein